MRADTDNHFLNKKRSQDNFNLGFVSGLQAALSKPLYPRVSPKGLIFSWLCKSVRNQLVRVIKISATGALVSQPWSSTVRSLVGSVPSMP
jgi:hypothetical protein